MEKPKQREKTRKSPEPDLRFASRENSETTQNKAGAHRTKSTKCMETASTTGSSRPCLRNMHKRITVCPNRINWIPGCICDGPVVMPVAWCVVTAWHLSSLLSTAPKASALCGALPSHYCTRNKLGRTERKSMC